MKFCVKCGNELMDEAFLCPKCGCMVNANSNHQKKEKKNVSTDEESKALTFVSFAYYLAMAMGIFWIILSLGHGNVDAYCYNGSYYTNCGGDYYASEEHLILAILFSFATLGLAIADTSIAYTQLKPLKRKLAGTVKIVVSVLMLIASFVFIQ